MTCSSPLGRDGMPFTETMRRLHGEIERLVYAAEIHCPNKEHKEVYKCRIPCAFHSKSGGAPDKGYCTLICFRGDLGDHVQQDDCSRPHRCDPCHPTQPECGPCNPRHHKMRDRNDRR